MLLRKMLRDMRLYKAQFLSIFLMSFVSIYIFSGVSSEWNGLKMVSEQFYQSANFADVYVYSRGFTEKMADKVEALEGVTGVERRLTMEGIADFDNKPKVQLHFIENNLISSFQVKEGEEFTETKDGIWLDNTFADAKGLSVGDNITLTVEEYQITKKIIGTVLSPEYIYFAGEDDIVPIRGNYGYAFLSKEAFPKEIPIFFTDLLITIKNTVDANMEDSIQEVFEGNSIILVKKDDLRSYVQLREEIKEHKAMGRIFPLAFLAVALLTMLTTMARLVTGQRIQIGVLKALGFKRNRILFHYISYGLWISLTGSFLGAVLGPITLPYLFYEAMKTMFVLPEWKPSIPMTVLSMMIITVVGCTLVTYMACRGVLKDTPSQALRPKPPKSVKHSFIDGFQLWRRLDFYTQWNLRDVFRCKVRSFMAIAGVLGCSALLLCAFGMQDTMEYIVTWNYEVINQFETRLELSEEVTEKQLKDILLRYNGEAILEGTVEIKANDKKKSGELLVLDDVTLIKFVDIERKQITLPEDQISISYKMAEQLGVEVGDEITWHPYGEEKWITSTIGSIYRTPFTQGVTLTRELYEVNGYKFRPSAVVTSDTVESSLDGISKIRTKDMLTESYRTMTEAMNTLVYVLMIAAVLLAAVVIYNLGVLSFTERQRELSTLKVIGFQTKKLRILLLNQNIWLTAVGIMAGIPVGLWILQYIFRFMGEVFDFMIVVDVSSYLYTIIGTLMVSIFVNRLYSKRVKEIDMVSSLKGVE